MTTLRKTLHAEHLPLIVGELSQLISEQYLQQDQILEFNRNLYHLAAQLPCCGVVNTQGLELKPDNLHFNAVSLRKLGVRYFEKYKELTTTNSI